MRYYLQFLKVTSKCLFAAIVAFKSAVILQSLSAVANDY